MNEQDLQVFIDAALHLFERFASEGASVETPYLQESGIYILDYSGAIGISGSRRGNIYFSTTKELLIDLLQEDGETNHSHRNLCDFVGEMANILSGRVRKVFGEQFMISVPAIIEKGRTQIALPTRRAYVVPLMWKNHRSMLIIALD